MRGVSFCISRFTETLQQGFHPDELGSIEEVQHQSAGCDSSGMHKHGLQVSRNSTARQMNNNSSHASNKYETHIADIHRNCHEKLTLQVTGAGRP